MNQVRNIHIGSFVKIIKLICKLLPHGNIGNRLEFYDALQVNTRNEIFKNSVTALLNFSSLEVLPVVYGKKIFPFYKINLYVDNLSECKKFYGPKIVEYLLKKINISTFMIEETHLIRVIELMNERISHLLGNINLNFKNIDEFLKSEMNKKSKKNVHEPATKVKKRNTDENSSVKSDDTDSDFYKSENEKKKSNTDENESNIDSSSSLKRKVSEIESNDSNNDEEEEEENDNELKSINKLKNNLNDKLKKLSQFVLLSAEINIPRLFHVDFENKLNDIELSAEIKDYTNSELYHNSNRSMIEIYKGLKYFKDLDINYNKFKKTPKSGDQHAENLKFFSESSKIDCKNFDCKNNEFYILSSHQKYFGDNNGGNNFLKFQMSKNLNNQNNDNTNNHANTSVNIKNDEKSFYERYKPDLEKLIDRIVTISQNDQRRKSMTQKEDGSNSGSNNVYLDPIEGMKQNEKRVKQRFIHITYSNYKVLTNLIHKNLSDLQIYKNELSLVKMNKNGFDKKNECEIVPANKIKDFEFSRIPIHPYTMLCIIQNESEKIRPGLHSLSFHPVHLRSNLYERFQDSQVIRDFVSSRKDKTLDSNEDTKFAAIGQNLDNKKIDEDEKIDKNMMPCSLKLYREQYDNILKNSNELIYLQAKYEEQLKDHFIELKKIITKNFDSKVLTKVNRYLKNIMNHINTVNMMIDIKKLNSIIECYNEYDLSNKSISKLSHMIHFFTPFENRKIAEQFTKNSNYYYASQTGAMSFTFIGKRVQELKKKIGNILGSTSISSLSNQMNGKNLNDWRLFSHEIDEGISNCLKNDFNFNFLNNELSMYLNQLNGLKLSVDKMGSKFWNIDHNCSDKKKNEILKRNINEKLNQIKLIMSNIKYVEQFKMLHQLRFKLETIYQNFNGDDNNNVIDNYIDNDKNDVIQLDLKLNEKNDNENKDDTKEVTNEEILFLSKDFIKDKKYETIIDLIKKIIFISKNVNDYSTTNNFNLNNSIDLNLINVFPLIRNQLSEILNNLKNENSGDDDDDENKHLKQCKNLFVKLIISLYGKDNMIHILKYFEENNTNEDSLKNNSFNDGGTQEKTSITSHHSMNINVGSPNLLEQLVELIGKCNNVKEFENEVNNFADDLTHHKNNEENVEMKSNSSDFKESSKELDEEEGKQKSNSHEDDEEEINADEKNDQVEKGKNEMDVEKSDLEKENKNIKYDENEILDLDDDEIEKMFNEEDLSTNNETNTLNEMNNPQEGINETFSNNYKNENVSLSSPFGQNRTSQHVTENFIKKYQFDSLGNGHINISMIHNLSPSDSDANIDNNKNNENVNNNVTDNNNNNDGNKKKKHDNNLFEVQYESIPKTSITNHINNENNRNNMAGNSIVTNPTVSGYHNVQDVSSHGSNNGSTNKIENNLILLSNSNQIKPSHCINNKNYYDNLFREGRKDRRIPFLTLEVKGKFCLNKNESVYYFLDPESEEALEKVENSINSKFLYKLNDTYHIYRTNDPETTKKYLNSKTYQNLKNDEAKLMNSLYKIPNLSIEKIDPIIHNAIYYSLSKQNTHRKKMNQIEESLVGKTISYTNMVRMYPNKFKYFYSSNIYAIRNLITYNESIPPISYTSRVDLANTQALSNSVTDRSMFILSNPGANVKFDNLSYISRSGIPLSAIDSYLTFVCFLKFCVDKDIFKSKIASKLNTIKSYVDMVQSIKNENDENVNGDQKNSSSKKKKNGKQNSKSASNRVLQDKTRKKYNGLKIFGNDLLINFMKKKHNVLLRYVYLFLKYTTDEKFEIKVKSLNKNFDIFKMLDSEHVEIEKVSTLEEHKIFTINKKDEEEDKEEDKEEDVEEEDVEEEDVEEEENEHEEENDEDQFTPYYIIRIDRAYIETIFKNEIRLLKILMKYNIEKIHKDLLNESNEPLVKIEQPNDSNVNSTVNNDARKKNLSVIRRLLTLTYILFFDQYMEEIVSIFKESMSIEEKLNEMLDYITDFSNYTTNRILYTKLMKHVHEKKKEIFLKETENLKLSSNEKTEIYTQLLGIDSNNFKTDILIDNCHDVYSNDNDIASQKFDGDNSSGNSKIHEDTYKVLRYISNDEICNYDKHILFNETISESEYFQNNNIQTNDDLTKTTQSDNKSLPIMNKEKICNDLLKSSRLNVDKFYEIEKMFDKLQFPSTFKEFETGYETNQKNEQTNDGMNNDKDKMQEDSEREENDDIGEEIQATEFEYMESIKTQMRFIMNCLSFESSWFYCNSYLNESNTMNQDYIKNYTNQMIKSSIQYLTVSEENTYKEMPNYFGNDDTNKNYKMLKQSDNSHELLEKTDTFNTSLRTLYDESNTYKYNNYRSYLIHWANNLKFSDNRYMNTPDTLNAFPFKTHSNNSLENPKAVLNYTKQTTPICLNMSEFNDVSNLTMEEQTFMSNKMNNTSPQFKNLYYHGAKELRSSDLITDFMILNDENYLNYCNTLSKILDNKQIKTNVANDKITQSGNCYVKKVPRNQFYLLLGCNSQNLRTLKKLTNNGEIKMNQLYDLIHNKTELKTTSLTNYFNAQMFCVTDFIQLNHTL
jgi:hypothetical protein